MSREEHTFYKISEQDPRFTGLLAQYRASDEVVERHKLEFGDLFEEESIKAQKKSEAYSGGTIKGIIEVAKVEGFVDLVDEKELKNRIKGYEWYPRYEWNPGAEHYADYKRVYVTTNPRIIEGEEDLTLEEKTKRRYLHESLHVLSGKGWHYIPGDKYALRIYKNGLRFENLYAHEAEDNPYSWLNEAVTEELTVKIWGKGYQRYASERMLYRMLRDSGRSPLTNADFFRSYFEAPDLSMPPGKRMPETTRLLRKINDAYPNDGSSLRILQGIDLSVQEAGVITTIHRVEDALVEKTADWKL